MARQVNNHIEAIDPKIEALLARAHERWNAGELRSAFRLFLAAAKGGEPSAQLDPGYFYDVGIGINPNRSKAFKWYLLTYRNGHFGGASGIGTIYRDADDHKRAFQWFERAVALGDVDANFEIAKMFLREKAQIPKALRYLRRVIKGKPGGNVTMHSWEQAHRLLKKHTAKKR
jgi:TPR repeat protein